MTNPLFITAAAATAVSKVGQIVRWVGRFASRISNRALVKAGSVAFPLTSNLFIFTMTRPIIGATGRVLATNPALGNSPVLGPLVSALGKKLIAFRSRLITSSGKGRSFRQSKDVVRMKQLTGELVNSTSSRTTEIVGELLQIINTNPTTFVQLWRVAASSPTLSILGVMSEISIFSALIGAILSTDNEELGPDEVADLATGILDGLKGEWTEFIRASDEFSTAEKEVAIASLLEAFEELDRNFGKGGVSDPISINDTIDELEGEAVTNEYILTYFAGRLGSHAEARRFVDTMALAVNQIKKGVF